MSFTDNQIKQEAKVLEGMLERHDYTGLHNKLLADSKITSKDEFNKLVGNLNDMNKEAQKTNGGLPSLEIHNDGWFGIGGSTDQIVLKDTNSGRKMELYENDTHRANEVAEQNKQADPYSFDLGRQAQKLTANEWYGAPDFQKDSSIPWTRNNAEAGAGYVVTDHRNRNSANSYDAVQDIQQKLNNGENLQTTNQYRYERRR